VYLITLTSPRARIESCVLQAQEKQPKKCPFPPGSTEETRKKRPQFWSALLGLHLRVLPVFDPKLVHFLSLRTVEPVEQQRRFYSWLRIGEVEINLQIHFLACWGLRGCQQWVKEIRGRGGYKREGQSCVFLEMGSFSLNLSTTSFCSFPVVVMANVNHHGT
jgi:hypothetical protein